MLDAASLRSQSYPAWSLRAVLLGHDRLDAVEQETRSRRRKPGQSVPPVVASVPAHAQLLLSLQGTAGNRAVCGEVQRLKEGLGSTRFLQRKVSTNNRDWIKKNGKLPQLPPAIAERYQQYVVDKAMALAREWRDDAVETNRKFLTPDAFYQTLFDHVVTQGQPAVVQRGDPWARLKHAVQIAGNLTEVPWSSFDPEQASLLEAELTACEVQVSSNSATTACHGNANGKLPKKVAGPDGETLDQVPYSQQPDYTPYIEFLVTGRKNETGIERGILDRDSGQIYLTAHYSVGSFVWLSGAPAALVADWQAKALQYCTGLRG